MNLASETTKNLLEPEDFVTGEQFEQLTKYSRTHTGGIVELITYTAVSKGKMDSHVWMKKYLSEDKERLYLNMIRNLFRKLDFIELNQALEMEGISEDDFDKELEEHEDDYLIPAPECSPTLQQVIQIADIVKKIGREKKVSVDEVSELFSLEMGKSIEILSK